MQPSSLNRREPSSAAAERDGRAFSSRALALAALSVTAAQAVLGPAASLSLRLAVAAAAGLLSLVGFTVAPAARAVAGLLAALALAGLTGILWQPVMAFALLLYFGFVRLAPSLAPSPTWRARGRLPGLSIALVAGVTPIGLLGWVLVLHPQLGDIVTAYGLRRYPLPLLIVGAALFAVVNALLEELIWRGVLLDRLTGLFGSALAIALQGISFGLQHFHGFPRGAIGALLAGSWGVMLGWLRWRSGGLAAPLIAHVVADTVIAVILLVLYR